MATLEEIEAAIRVADKAGRKDDVQALGAEWQRLKAEPTPGPDASGPAGEMSKFRAMEHADPVPDNVQTGSSGLPLIGNNPVTNAVANTFYGGEKAIKDRWLGLKQYLASEPTAVTKKFLPQTDIDALTQTSKNLKMEAAEKERHDRPLMDTTAGKVGKYGTDIGINMAPMVATGGMSMLPQIATSVGISGLEGMLDPSKDYDALKQGGIGAAFGLGGELGGRLAGRLIMPLRNIIGEHAQEGIDVIKNSALGDKVKMLAGHLVDSDSGIKAAHDAMSKIPILGSLINKADKGASAELTGVATKRAGQETKTLTQKSGREMWDNLEQAGQRFREGNDVPMKPVANYLKDAEKDIAEYLATTGQAGRASKLGKAGDVLSDTPGATVPRSVQERVAQRQAGRGETVSTRGAGTPKVMTANEVMDMRRAASELAFKETDPKLAAKYRGYRDSLDDAYRQANPAPVNAKGEHPFDQWRREWGAMEEVNQAGKNMKQGHLTPAELEKTLSERAQGVAPGSHRDPDTAKFEELVVAMKDRFKPPPEGNNRALLNSLLLGGSLGGLGISGAKLSDDPVVSAAGAVAPTGLAAYLLGTQGGGRYLTGTKKNQAAAAAMARMLTMAGAATAAGNRNP